jgi:hypothetical protein
MQQSESFPFRPNTMLYGAGAVALFGLIFSLAGAVIDFNHFLQIYLVAFLFLLELSLGCLALLFLPPVVGARWNVMVERFAAAGARTMPLLAIMFLPILFGMNELFEWTGSSVPSGVDPVPGHYYYLTPAFFFIRAVIYFAVWIGLAWALTTWSYQSDREPGEGLRRRSFFWSIVGAILFFLTVTFSAFDWSMAIDEEWMSTVWGWLTISRSALAGFAFLIVMLSLFWARKPLSDVADDRSVNDLASMLLVSLLAWMYLSLMQYIVIWSGNVSSKAVWYAERMEGSWEGLAGLLVIVHMTALAMLLVPGLKKMRPALVGIAILLLFMRLLDLYWVIVPKFSAEFQLEWWDFALPLFLGGVWFALFIWMLKDHKLVPVNHPELESVEFTEEGYETAQ